MTEHLLHLHYTTIGLNLAKSFNMVISTYLRWQVMNLTQPYIAIWSITLLYGNLMAKIVRNVILIPSYFTQKP